MGSKLYVIGIGFKPLDKRAQEIILNSSFILASNRLFEVLKEYDEFEAVKDKVKVINNVNETIEFIRTEVRKCGSTELKNFRTSELPGSRAIVLLASGDPMFFGIGRRAVNEFGKDIVEILPDLSSIQIAFSKIKEPWDDAFLMSLHGGPDPEKRRHLPYEIKDLPWLIEKYHKIAILTDKENNPSKIATALLPCCSATLRIYVCERLGYCDEKITEGTPEEIASMTFREPNVVIIIRAAEQQSNRAAATTLEEIKFGLTEKEILHSRGLITKDEVRAVTIHKLRLPQRGVFWDIGAGSGSVSIEAARLYPELKVFAVEKNAEQINHIQENRIRFNATNIEIVKAEAPESLSGLPRPDRVFIGGSGERLKEIMDYIIKTQVKLIVVNATTIETINDTIECFENHGYNTSISEISVSRAKTIAGKRHMSALNPIFVIKGEK